MPHFAVEHKTYKYMHDDMTKKRERKKYYQGINNIDHKQITFRATATIPCA